MKKRALIIGISGQDGSLMADYLIKKKYLVFGISRRKNNLNCINLIRLGINNRVKILNLDVENYKKLLSLINKLKPQEIYQLSSVSSIRIAKTKPLNTLKYIFHITYNLLQICKIKKNIKIYFSGTGQIFDYKEKNISEKSKIFPRNIYSYSKNIALNLVARYRNLYGLKVCTGITFNHESHLRSKEFVTMKIIKDAISVKNNKKNKITLSNVDSYCDWGWAPEYVEAMWKMLQRNEFNDYIIATGKTHSVFNFVKIIFKKLKINFRDNLNIINKKYDVNNKFQVSTKKINDELNWRASTYMRDIAILMLQKQYEKIN
jgi:GDPmannose 4,6-dehydratase